MTKTFWILSISSNAIVVIVSAIIAYICDPVLPEGNSRNTRFAWILVDIAIVEVVSLLSVVYEAVIVAVVVVAIFVLLSAAIVAVVVAVESGIAVVIV